MAVRGIFVAPNGSAVQSKSGKGAPGARVSENLRIQFPIGICRSMAAHGTGCGRCVPAKLELAGKQLLHAAFILDDHDEVNAFNADLQSPASAGDGEEHWRAPAICCPAGGHATAIFSAEDKAALEQMGYNGNALCVL